MPSRQRKVAYIHYLLRNDMFYDAADHVEADPSAAAALNSAKSTPLLVLVKALTWGTVEMAIRQNIRRFVEGFQLAFDAILDACPGAVQHANKYGDTALIVACRDGRADELGLTSRGRGAPLDPLDEMKRYVILRMIDVCPDAAKIADRNGQLPLQHTIHLGYGPMDLVTELVRAYPESLLMGGSNPIVDLIQHSCSIHLDRVKSLLALCPAAAVSMSSGLTNAIQELWFRIRNRQRERQRGLPLLPHVPSRLTDDMIAEISGKMEDGDEDDDEGFYPKARDLLLLLLKSGYHNTCDDDEVPSFRALHAAAGLTVPSDLLRLVIRLFPEQLHEVDVEGRTPLHIAAAGPYHSRGFDEIDVPTGLEILARAYPDATRVLDRNGMLPIHLALKDHKSWKFGVRALVEAEPMTLRLETGDSGMYAFMLAATSGTIHSQWDNADLDTVYQLLRTNPDALRLARGRH